MRTIDAVETVVFSGRSGFCFELALLSARGEQGLEPGGLGDRVAPGGGRRESVLGGLSAASLLRTPPPGATRSPFTGVGVGCALGDVVLDGGTDIRRERRPLLIGNQPETSGTNAPTMPAQEGLSWNVDASVVLAPFSTVLSSALRNGFALTAAAVALAATLVAQADRSLTILGAVL